MGLISYIQDIPDAPNNPSFDQPSMKLNNNAIPAFLAVDHQPFNTNESGYHTIIHQRSTLGSVDPAAIANIGQIYVKNVVTNAVNDTQLFFRSGLGIISRFTGGLALGDGFQYVGLVLMQWGSTTAVTSSSSTTVTFPIPFPANVFSVQVTIVTNSNSTIRLSLLNDATLTGFTTTQTSSSNFTKMYWFAIGN